MIKNQLLNTCFDDLCAQKNNRKNMLEGLVVTLINY